VMLAMTGRRNFEDNWLGSASVPVQEWAALMAREEERSRHTLSPAAEPFPRGGVID
jgi:hypothetical protein